jgi:hypothetical protein
MIDAYCAICRKEVPEARARWGAFTCSNDCQKEYKRRLRADYREHGCPHCGRKGTKSENPATDSREHQEAQGS